jgi:hypothetical protein
LPWDRGVFPPHNTVFFLLVPFGATSIDAIRAGLEFELEKEIPNEITVGHKDND